MTPRALDHCVLPVADLAIARDRYAALGFTVAPQGTHPFGTINACVYFADDTFLESLAIGNAAQVDEAVRSDNMFVSRDAAYRQAVGENGFSALVFKSDDAHADHEAFAGAGISAGPMLDFSRDFVDADGKAGMVSFRLALAAHPTSEAAYFFTCQRINAPSAAGRATLERHANGVTGIAGVGLVAADSVEHERFLSELTQAAVTHGDAGIASDALRIGEGEGPLRLDTIRFQVGDLDATEECFRSNDVAFKRNDAQLTVEPAPGQGAIFIFEERS